MKYYVYTHFRQDKNEIFYVGIGTKNFSDLRYNTYSRAFTKNNRTKYWKNIISLNPQYLINIILESDNYDKIKEKEIQLIQKYGRKDLNKGSLCNFTDGGEGQKNRIFSIQTREKISINRKNKCLGKDNFFFNKHHTKQSRIKMSQYRKGINVSEITKQRMAKSHSKKIIINNITYSSIKEAAISLNMNNATLGRWIKKEKI